MIRRSAAIAAAAIVAVVAVAFLVLSAGSSTSPAPAGPATRTAHRDCSDRSEANFPKAFTSPRNLAVGPLVLIGGAMYVPKDSVRRHGGAKFPLLVKAGHTVTVRIAQRSRGLAGLNYTHSARGQITLRDAPQSVTFVACRGVRSSGSDAGRTPVTFWSGFVLTRAPACVALDIYVDRGHSPRSVRLPIGERCGS